MDPTLKTDPVSSIQTDQKPGGGRLLTENQPLALVTFPTILRSENQLFQANAGAPGTVSSNFLLHKLLKHCNSYESKINIFVA